MGDAEAFEEKFGTPTAENVARFLTYDVANPGSLITSIRAARSNARSVREFITLEMWEQINHLYLDVNRAAEAQITTQEFFRETAKACQLINGITDANMSHDEGWQFFRMGRKVERADKTTRMLDARYLFAPSDDPLAARPYEAILWAALLRSTSALQMYRQRHQQFEPKRLVEFLILDRAFPRSVRHCVGGIEESGRAVSGTPEGMFSNHAEQVAGRLDAYLNFMHVDEIMAEGVHAFIDRLQMQFNDLSDAILSTYFGRG
jgi:uncharacterized alpha-E superfamily protein